MFDDHPHGLRADLPLLQRLAVPAEPAIARRRHALRLLGGLGLAGGLPLIAACGGGGDSSTDSGSSTTTSGGGTTTATTTTTTTSTTGSCSTIPSETAGPYPGDGTNSNGSGVVNALALSGIVRSDIRSSVGSASGTASGVPLTVTLTLVNTGGSCAALSGYAVYLWHCDAGGNYSLYSSRVLNQNYLRGVQVSNGSGQVTFTTIVPGCYSGRWPHMHFEIFRTLAEATSGANDIRTSQLALPADVCQAVYTQSGYSGSAANLAAISLASDNVFSGGTSLQMATVTGSVAAGYAATLQVGVSV
jgi:protocatechuate 3,4-dioxygenase beta subunit